MRGLEVLSMSRPSQYRRHSARARTSLGARNQGLLARAEARPRRSERGGCMLPRPGHPEFDPLAMARTVAPDGTTCLVWRPRSRPKRACGLTCHSVGRVVGRCPGAVRPKWGNNGSVYAVFVKRPKASVTHARVA